MFTVIPIFLYLINVLKYLFLVYFIKVHYLQNKFYLIDQFNDLHIFSITFLCFKQEYYLIEQFPYISYRIDLYQQYHYFNTIKINQQNYFIYYIYSIIDFNDFLKATNFVTKFYNQQLNYYNKILYFFNIINHYQNKYY